MIDPHFFKRNSFDLVKENLKKRNYHLDLNPLSLIIQRKNLILELEESQHKKNILSKNIGDIKLQENNKKDNLPINLLKSKVSEISHYIKNIKEKLNILEKKYQNLILSIPNILHSDVPEGLSEENNLLVKQVGQIPQYNFEVKPHYQIAKELNLIDFERGARLAGSRFYIYNEKISSLERGLITTMLNMHKQRGYLERTIPLLVKNECMQNTGQFPKFYDEYYHIATDNLNLIPTAEVPLTNIYQNEILMEHQLPIYLSSATPCFRRESGAAGKETRGIIRVHQFQKVELVKFVKPEESDNELKKLLEDVENILKKFSLTYRIMLLCSAEVGFSSSKTYDFEVWFPGSKRWIEISSCSNFIDFQSRRAKIRFKDTLTGKNKLVHTLNGSGVAAGRLVAALLEYHQNEDGKINWDAIQKKSDFK